MDAATGPDFDQPPPDTLPDVEALLAGDAIRFASQVHAWIEVEDGRITSHGMSGQGRLGSTTVRLRSRGLTFAGVALPDLTPPPRVLKDRVVFTQTAGGHTGAPVPRPVTQPPFWRLAAPDRLDHRHADPARRRDLRRPARRRQPVSPLLPVRQHRAAHPQERPDPVQGLDQAIRAR